MQLKLQTFLVVGRRLIPRDTPSLLLLTGPKTILSKRNVGMDAIYSNLVTVVSGSRLRFMRSGSCKRSNPGFMPGTIFPKLSSSPRALAPFIVAHRISSSNRTDGKCFWISFSSERMLRLLFEARESVPTTSSHPSDISISTGGILFSMYIFDPGQRHQKVF